MKPRFSMTPFTAGERPGLQGLDKCHRGCIECEQRNTRNIISSVNVDRTMKPLMQNEKRWDYIIWYEGSTPILPCIEVHPSNTGHVDDVISKKAWLESLIRGYDLPARRYFWVPTSGVAPSAQSLQSRKLAEACIIRSRIVRIDQIDGDKE
jgi:hypothetical protein